jgi:probable rRNA maturation factor
MQKNHIEISNQYSQLTHSAEAAALFEALVDSGQFPIASGELSVVFVDDATIAQVHADFMHDPTPTDVITFPANQAMESAGEIIVSVDHAMARAQELDIPFTRELSLYLIHGWLHLAGYDDRNEIDRVAMRAAELQALQILDAAGAGANFRVNR